MADKAGLTESTIASMKQMTAEPLKAAAIVQDETCLGGLVMVLSNKDKNIVKTALETLERLAKLTEYRYLMKQSLGMMPQLNSIANMDCPDLSELALKIYEDLAHCGSKQLAGDQCQVNHALRDTANTHRKQNTVKEQTQRRRRNSFFLGGVAKCKTVVLQIKGMDHRDDVELCRNSLLTVSGIISITFDYKKHRAVIRAKPELKPEVLGNAVAKTMTMSAQLVSKDDCGEEVLMPLTQDRGSANKENEHLMPDYPSSDDDRSPQRHNDVARIGGTPHDSSGSWGFVKSVGSFLSNSFYW